MCAFSCALMRYALILILLSITAAAAAAPWPWCAPGTPGATWVLAELQQQSAQWSHAQGVATTCSIFAHPPLAADAAYDIVSLRVNTTAAIQEALLFDCPSDAWILQQLQDPYRSCAVHTQSLMALCHRWMLAPSPPAASNSSNSTSSSVTCAPQGLHFGTYTPSTAAHRRLVLQVTASGTRSSDTTLELGHQNTQSAVTRGGQTMGVIQGRPVTPPSELTHAMQALTVPHPAPTQPSPAAADTVMAADFKCGRRCQHQPLWRGPQKHVSLVGFELRMGPQAQGGFFHLQRGLAASRQGLQGFRQQVLVAATATGADAAVAGDPAAASNITHSSSSSSSGSSIVVDLLSGQQESLQLWLGDTVRWGCTYNTTTSDSGSINAAVAGMPSSPVSTDEGTVSTGQCELLLHYWPRVEGLAGCITLSDADPAMGEDLCMYEAAAYLQRHQAEQQTLPIRSYYRTHTFHPEPWESTWKATTLVAYMLGLLGAMYGFKLALLHCTWLGPAHTRFAGLPGGQQRNVALYLVHLVVDTALLVQLPVAAAVVSGATETGAEVAVGGWVLFDYLVAFYLVELIWRGSPDLMLVIHHVGTILAITVLASEMVQYTYRFGASLVIIALFAILEQPTYVALLLKRMLHANNPLVPLSMAAAAYSWFALKGLSVVLGVLSLRRDWGVMPHWARVNFIMVWVVATIIQMWSGWIQLGIYEGTRRRYQMARTRRDTLQQRHSLTPSQSGSLGGTLVNSLDALTGYLPSVPSAPVPSHKPQPLLSPRQLQKQVSALQQQASIRQRAALQQQGSVQAQQGRLLQQQVSQRQQATMLPTQTSVQQLQQQELGKLEPLLQQPVRSSSQLPSLDPAAPDAEHAEEEDDVSTSSASQVSDPSDTRSDTSDETGDLDGEVEGEEVALLAGQQDSAGVVDGECEASDMRSAFARPGPRLPGLAGSS